MGMIIAILVTAAATSLFWILFYKHNQNKMATMRGAIVDVWHKLPPEVQSVLEKFTKK